MNLKGENNLASSSNNENPLGDEEFLNLVLGEVGSQFHTKDKKEIIYNPQHERERCFFCKAHDGRILAWLGNQCTTTDEYLKAMKTEFLKNEIKLDKSFSLKN